MSNNDSKICQYIVVDKQLNMTPGKFGAQVSHASMAWIVNQCKKVAFVNNTYDGVNCDLWFPMDVWNGWLNGAFTKVVLGVKGKKGLEKVVKKAEDAGFIEGQDFFCIRDNCLTELIPDETGTCFTCIGFAPMAKDKLASVVGKLQLYK